MNFFFLSYPFLKSLHIIALVAWFSGLFYLPRLFVYHAMEGEKPAIHGLLSIMEYRLFWYIMTPSAVFTVGSGVGLLSFSGLWGVYRSHLWLHAKFFLVLLLLFYHLFCLYYLRSFQKQNNHRSHRFFRLFNEIPSLLLIGIVALVVFKPV